MSIRRIGRRRVVTSGTGPAAAADSPGPSDAAPDAGVRLEQTSDDTPRAWGEADASTGGADADRDAWLRAQRPPHWE